MTRIATSRLYSICARATESRWILLKWHVMEQFTNHLLNTSRLIFITLIVSLYACSATVSFEEEIRKVNFNQTYRLNEIDSRFESHHLCILSPYQNRIFPKFSDSSFLNEALDKVKFEPNESATLIFFDSNYSIIIERLDGLYLRTTDNKTPATEELHDCGLSKNFYLYKFSASVLSILREPSSK